MLGDGINYKWTKGEVCKDCEESEDILVTGISDNVQEKPEVTHCGCGFRIVDHNGNTPERIDFLRYHCMVVFKDSIWRLDYPNGDSVAFDMPAQWVKEKKRKKSKDANETQSHTV